MVAMEQTVWSRKRTRRLVYYALGASLVVLFAGWWTGSGALLQSPADRLIAIGRLFGLLATYGVLLEMFLMSRLPLIEKNFDLGETVTWHKLNGYAVLATITGHVVFLLMGYGMQGHLGWWPQFLQFNTQFEEVLSATAGTVVFFGAAAISVQAVRRKLRYEVWHLAHLAMYLAILMAFSHQLQNGGDFIGHTWFSAYWYAIYFFAFATVGYFRFLRPAINYYRHRFKVLEVRQEADTVYSVYITGKDISKFRFEPGQYATWHILSGRLWLEGHPFSFSSQPGGEVIRFTAKATGDFSARIQNLQPGTPIVIDGPRGSFTAERAGSYTVLLVAGGIGITPYIAMIDALLKEGKAVTLLYAIRSAGDMAFRSELDELQQRGLKMRTFIGEQKQRIDRQILEQYAAKSDTVVYVCGPEGMSRAMTETLHTLGLPKRQIITERFAV